LLQQGSRWLEDRRHEHLTRSVTYQRGVNSVTLQATIGKTVFDQQDQFGVVQRTESRDFLVRAIDLTFAGRQTLPQAGDRIVESDGAPSLLYEVVSIGAEPPFRFSDPERATLRIHTKFIGLEATP